MMCPECGSSRVTSAPDTLPVCRDCDWTGWQKNPPIDQARFEEGLLDTDEARLARGKTAAVAADQAATTDFLAAFAEAEEAAHSPQCRTCTLPDHACPLVPGCPCCSDTQTRVLTELAARNTTPCPKGHTWVLVRRYAGVEDFTVRTITDAETGDDIPLDSLQPGHDRSFNLVIADTRNNDEYDGVIEEYLECQYCPAKIVGDVIGYVEQ